MWRWGSRRSSSIIPLCGDHSRGTGSTPWLGRMVFSCPVGNANASAKLAPSIASPNYWCWMKPLRHWMLKPSGSLLRLWTPCAGDVTLIVIAHRLATVRHCDQVIHLSAGRITGRGTFAQVRAQVPECNRQAELLGL